MLEKLSKIYLAAVLTFCVKATIPALRFLTMPSVLDIIFWIANVISFFAFLKLLNRSSIVVSQAFNKSFANE